MTRRDQILNATLEVAAQHGLRSVTLAQIAERVGMKKPSLYNHFKSKDDIVHETYRYAREQALGKSIMPNVDLKSLFAGKTLEQILLTLLDQYCSLVLDKDLLRLFVVLYAERSTNPDAAQILLEETDHMVQQVTSLFHALEEEGKLRCDDIDMVALSFAMTVHALVDYQLDELCARDERPGSDLATFAQARAYVSWFSRQMEACHA